MATEKSNTALAGTKRGRAHDLALVNLAPETMGLNIAFEVEKDALIHEARRVAALSSHMQGVSIAAANAFAVLDARDARLDLDLDFEAGNDSALKFTDILLPLRTLGQRADIE